MYSRGNDKYAKRALTYGKGLISIGGMHTDRNRHFISERGWSGKKYDHYRIKRMLSSACLGHTNGRAGWSASSHRVAHYRAVVGWLSKGAASSSSPSLSHYPSLCRQQAFTRFL